MTSLDYQAEQEATPKAKTQHEQSETRRIKAIREQMERDLEECYVCRHVRRFCTCDEFVDYVESVRRAWAWKEGLA